MIKKINKKILFTIVMFFLIIVFFSNTIYAYTHNEVTISIVTNEEEGRKTSDVIADLRKLGCKLDSLYDGKMKIDTTIKFEKKQTEVSGDDDGGRAKSTTYYYVKIGNSDTIKLTENQFEKFGGSGKTEGASWKIVLQVKYQANEHGKDDNEDQLVQGYKIVTTDIYYGDNIPELPDYEGEKIDVDRKSQSEVVKDTFGIVFKLVDFAKAFEHNPGGTLGCLACDVIINTLGDICQTFANFFQTGFVVGESITETIRPKLLPVFTYDYLVSNPGYDKYTNVAKAEPSEGYDGVNRIKIENQEYGFTEETKIPVAIVDFEALARNKVSNLDANFLIDDKNDTHSVIWRTLRNAVAVIIRIVIFLSAAFLLTILIINAIAIATSSITPIERKARIDSIQNFAKAVFMLIGTVVIMAIGIYSNIMIFNIVDNAKNTNEIETNELPIRVYVEEARYSFSTTTTGYMRYMASIDNVDKAKEKAKYSFTYLMMAIFNLFFAILMFIRMLAIFGLAIIGPLIVIQDVIQDIIPIAIVQINYRTWAIWFLMISVFQALMAIGCAILKITI